MLYSYGLEIMPVSQNNTDIILGGMLELRYMMLCSYYIKIILARLNSY